jgi:hypothetical protein
MRSPALALVWELSRRHRWGLGAVGAYAIGLVAMRALHLGPAPGATISPERFAATLVVPMTMACFYLLAVFSFGMSGDVAARQSLYPARAFTLPVTSAALAGWPMLYGTAAIAGLWLVTANVASWPSWFQVPRIWPALLLAAILAWTQALTWAAYPLPGLRVVAAVLWLTVADVVAVLAIEFKPSEPLMVALLTPQLPLAYLAARAAVARARRGDVPDWRAAFTRRARGATHAGAGSAHFATAAGAQAWYEWRQHGWSLPLWVGILLPFELALLFIVETRVYILIILLGVLLTPPVMAAFVAATVGKAEPGTRAASGLTAFQATRPVTSAALVAAKLRVTVVSTMVTWLLLLVAVPAGLALSSTWPVVSGWAGAMRDTIGMPRAIVVTLLALAALMTLTWKRLVQSLYVGLSGRAWLVRAHMGLTLAALVAIVPLLQWIDESSAARVAIWNGLRWVPAVLVLAKMSVAARVVTQLHRERLLGDRALVGGAACWVAAVLALYGVLLWLVSTPHIPRDFLLLLAILAVPLARVSAAPLALAWNRHRP